LRDAFGARFLLGAFCVLGLGLHLWGGGFALQYQEIGGWPVALFYLYAAALMFCTGWLIDVRLISALAIVPFAQMLDTGGFYFDAVYAFYSPEPTLSVLQMGLLLVACLWVARHVADRTARHARIVAVLAFVVLNLCALVGSIFGDVVGATIWGPEYPRFTHWASREDAIAAWRDAYDAFAARTLVISEGVFSLLWGAALVAVLYRAAQAANRGLFHTALTFGVIHVYTQLFESFGDKPGVWALAGLMLIPVAWGMKRADTLLRTRAGSAERS
jgi:hypothetical protein